MTAKSWIGRAAASVAMGMILILATTAFAQVGSLYYKEVEKDGRIYVFNTPERLKSFEASGDMGTAITLVGRGPKGETIVAENETALDLFLFKHNLEAYDRPTAKPAAPAAPIAPMTLKVGSEGELRFNGLLQAWYVGDSSPAGSASKSSQYGNIPGNNTFLIRRAELTLSGRINPRWGFVAQFDPAKSQSFTASGLPTTDDKILQDLTISYFGVKGQEFAAGQRRIVIGEEGIHSSSDLDFAERTRMSRTFSDRRETGVFYKGDLGKMVGLWASVTNGTRSNVISASNDTVFGALRLDIKPVPGLLFGASGGYTAGTTPQHLSYDVYGGHFRWDGTDKVPLWIHAEYLTSVNKVANAADLKRDGYFGAVLYTFAKKYRIGVRYDLMDNNKDVPNNKIKTLTTAFQFLPMGKNLNFRFQWDKVKEEGRQINSQLAEDYNVGLVTAQIYF